MTRVRVPIGVIGIIYESRPNVTADAGALCHEVRQCRHPARRFETAMSAPADRRAACRPAWRGRPAGRRDTDGAHHGPRGGRHDAAQASAAPSTSSCRAAASRWSPGWQEEAACRCSPIWKASATSMSTRPPTSTWLCASSSTPRCAAPACAAQPNACWSIATSPESHAPAILDAPA
jgi:hypothetical protein